MFRVEGSKICDHNFATKQKVDAQSFRLDWRSSEHAEQNPRNLESPAPSSALRCETTLKKLWRSKAREESGKRGNHSAEASLLRGGSLGPEQSTPKQNSTLFPGLFCHGADHYLCRIWDLVGIDWLSRSNFCLGVSTAL